MALMTNEVLEQVREYLEKMDDPVTVVMYPHAESPASQAMEQLLQELSTANPKVMVDYRNEAPPLVAPETAEDIESSIALLVHKGESTGVRYLGFPGGHEFGPFLESLVAVSNQTAPTVSAATREYLEQVNQPLHFQVFVTPT